MIYLVGVNHNIQHDGNGCAPKADREEFAGVLNVLIMKFEIKVLAEEFNQEAIDTSYALHSTVKEVADNVGIKHLFCEPNNNERTQLGILPESEKKVRGEIRENEWLNRLKSNNCLSSNILFICGASHIESFKSLLEKNGSRVKVEISYFKKPE